MAQMTPRQNEPVRDSFAMVEPHHRPWLAAYGILAGVMQSAGDFRRADQEGAA